MKTACSSTIKQLDEFNFYQTLEQSQGLVLVFFSGVDCGSCRHLRQVLEAYQGIWGNISIYEVDAGLSASLTNEFDVFHLPSIFLFKNGVYHCPIHAEPLPNSLYEAILKGSASDAEEQP